MHRNFLALHSKDDPGLPVGIDFLPPLEMTPEDVEAAKAREERRQRRIAIQGMRLVKNA